MTHDSVTQLCRFCSMQATEIQLALSDTSTANELTILVPVVLGLGCSKLRHKLAALLHQFLLEAGVERLQEYCLSVTGICTDQGVESGVYDAPAVDLRRHLELEAAALGRECASQLSAGEGESAADAFLFPLEAPQDALQLADDVEEWSPKQDSLATHKVSMFVV